MIRDPLTTSRKQSLRYGVYAKILLAGFLWNISFGSAIGGVIIGLGSTCNAILCVALLCWGTALVGCGETEDGAACVEIFLPFPRSVNLDTVWGWSLEIILFASYLLMDCQSLAL